MCLLDDSPTAECYGVSANLGSGAASEPRVPGRFRGRWFRAEFQGSVPGQPPVWFLNYFSIAVPAELEKDVHADFLCLHCYPNAVGDNTWAYLVMILDDIGDKISWVWGMCGNASSEAASVITASQKLHFKSHEHTLGIQLIQSPSENGNGT